MLQALRKRVDEDQQGFTLIELLVVVIIIGILAAIAIPVFLNQRERAWRSAVQSDLRNAAVEMETYYTDTGEYPDAVTETDYQATPSVNVTGGGTGANNQTYCLTGNHTNLPDADPAFTYSPDEGGLSAFEQDFC